MMEVGLLTMSGNLKSQTRTQDSSDTVQGHFLTRIPIIKVGLLEGYKRIEFRLIGRFAFTDLKGNILFDSIKSSLKWRVQIEESAPSKFNYQVHLMSFNSLAQAQDSANSLKARGYPVLIKQISEPDFGDPDSKKYHLLLGDFISEDRCEKYLKEFESSYSPKIVRNLITPSSGKIEFFDLEYDLAKFVDDGFRIFPLEAEDSVTIYKVKVGAGYHWEDTVDRSYSGILEIRIDHSGQLCAINEVSLDVYIAGVVASEMPNNYPLEALKAQAVAARCQALNKYSSKHPSEYYNLCASVHCQVYSGVSGASELSDQAVEETAGEILTYNGEICDAVYSSVCGGHTELLENVWNLSPKKYLDSFYDCLDGEVEPVNLTREKDVLKWVENKPKVFCNVSEYQIPSVLNGAVKYFRWEETYNRKRLEEIIRRKTRVDIGTFVGIEPLKRGTSGRLIEIEILGTRTNLTIKNELNIRKSLSESALKSSCFYVTMTYDDDGIPVEVTFHGAGWGHGVGMCQVGAAVMATEGFNYRQILEHYYPGSKLEKFYSIDSLKVELK